jgi:TolB-like protein/DNA-binding winged helix-turn-helix (wHTH) protein/Flp pilus assembly protein TadD
MESLSTIVRFGPYELRPRTRELYKQGTKLKLRPQPFQVLQVLVKHAGDVVTREELRKLLWSSETFVDFEHGLNTSIKELRAVLNDSANKPRYIETLPKLGYRIIMPVRRQEQPLLEAAASTPAPVAAIHVTSNNGEEGIQRPAAVRRLAVVFGVSSVLIAAALGAYFEWSHSRVSAQPAAAKLMLAVLPFENLTGDAGQDYFSDGLTEEMIAQLGRLEPGRLSVIARTSVMHYKHGQEQLDKIGRELGVQYVLEGSVRRDAEKVRISAQLIQMKDQTHLWARQYDRELRHVLALQGEIAQDIAGEIQTALGEPKRAVRPYRVSPSSSSYEAYDLYLKGRYFWNKRTLHGFQRAVEYFQLAIEKEPDYSRAYAGLSDSYALMSGYAGIPPGNLRPKAQAAAERAVELDEQSGEAHTSRALVAQNFDWDWKVAEKEYRRAIELDPNYATAHHWYAEYLAQMGRFDEALVESERARQLDPLSLVIAADNGVILYYSRQYDRAIEQFRAALDMDPTFPRAHMVQAAYAQKGMYADSLAVISKWQPGPGYWSNLAYDYGRSGRQAEAQLALRELQKLDRRQPVDPLTFCVAYIGMNKNNQAVTSLQKAFEEHSISLASLKVDPIYDPLRSDPRFQDLLRHIGLAP